METAPFKTSVPRPAPKRCSAPLNCSSNWRALTGSGGDRSARLEWQHPGALDPVSPGVVDVARACHDALGIEHPQRQLGTYPNQPGIPIPPSGSTLEIGQPRAMLWAVPWMEVVITVCQGCGSRSADRALAGRLVCQNCGLAAGSRPARKTTAKPPLRRAQPLGLVPPASDRGGGRGAAHGLISHLGGVRRQRSLSQLLDRLQHHLLPLGAVSVDATEHLGHPRR